MLEHFLREDLKLKTIRPMAIIDPLKVVITNYPEGKVEELTALNNNENEDHVLFAFEISENDLNKICDELKIK